MTAHNNTAPEDEDWLDEELNSLTMDAYYTGKGTVKFSLEDLKRDTKAAIHAHVEEERRKARIDELEGLLNDGMFFTSDVEQRELSGRIKELAQLSGEEPADAG